MNSLSMFPYVLVEKGSRIILYGAGNVGKDFYLQIHYSGYCDIVAWVDKEFDDYEPKAPFAKVNDIDKYEYDCIVIAISNSETANNVRLELIDKGVDETKIVWSSTYYGVDHTIFPNSNQKLISDPNYYFGIMDSQTAVQSKYGGLGFYQSFLQIGFPGSRNSGERINLYKMRDYLKENDSVLDIGCNCGFLDLQIAPFVGEVLGIDIEQGFIDVANRTKEQLKIDNASFKCINFYEENIVREFDAVFSFAVHELMLQNFTEKEYVDRISNLIRAGGYLFFESHDTRTDRELFERLCSLFHDNGMIEVMREEYCDFPSKLNRIIVVMKKSE